VGSTGLVPPVVPSNSRRRVSSESNLELAQLSVCTLDASPAIQLGPNSLHPVDFVFTQDNEQSRDVQDRLADTLVPDIHRAVSEGYDITLLAYGMTGSGKSRAIADTVGKVAAGLFPILDAEAVSVTAYQIYGDDIMDLFSADQGFLHAAKTQAVEGIIAGLESRTAHDAISLFHLFDTAARLRASRSTLLSPYSSRSHLFFRIKSVRSLVVFVDLAGSEDPTSSGAFAEGVKINQSLLQLGIVVDALRLNSHYIPWRDSMLTRMLESGLDTGSGGKLRLIACVSPFVRDLGDTTRTLQFASKARGLILEAEVNIVDTEPKVDWEAVVLSLRRENEKLKKRNMEFEIRLDRRGEIFGMVGMLDTPEPKDKSPKTPVLNFDLAAEEGPITPDVETPTRLESPGFEHGQSIEPEQDVEVEAVIELPEDAPADEVEAVGKPTVIEEEAPFVEEEVPAVEQDQPLASQESDSIHRSPQDSADLDREISLLINTHDPPGLLTLFQSLQPSDHSSFVSLLAKRATDLKQRNLMLRNVDRLKIAGKILGVSEEAQRNRKEEDPVRTPVKVVEVKDDVRRSARPRRKGKGKENEVGKHSGEDFLAIVAANFGKKRAE